MAGKAAPELVERFEQLVELVGDADRKLVFGCPSCLVGGNMFFGVHATGLFVKLPPDAGADLIGEGGRPFEPMPGRVMGGFYVLPDGEVSRWVRRSYDFARTLPIKKKKAGPRATSR